MKKANNIKSFWREYLLTLPHSQRNQQYTEASSWGNSPELADRIAELIVSGVKTTTSSLLWSQQKHKWRLEEPGDKSIVLDSHKNPVCVVQIEQVYIKPFDEVDEEFVYNYGEGDRTMNFWNKNMWEYYKEECMELGKKARKDMPMICQVFRVVYTGNRTSST
jgi:uncharacterized protein YhfF